MDANNPDRLTAVTRIQAEPSLAGAGTITAAGTSGTMQPAGSLRMAQENKMNETQIPAAENITTADEARAYLTGRGYDDEQVAATLLEANRFPGRYAYTADRCAWAVRHMPGNDWQAGDSTTAEKRLAALRTAARNSWRLVQ